MERARLVWKLGSALLVIGWTSLLWAGLLGLPAWALWLTWVGPGTAGVLLHKRADRLYVRAGGSKVQRIFQGPPWNFC